MGSIISAIGGLSSALCSCNQNKTRIDGIFCCVRNTSLNSEFKEVSNKIDMKSSGSSSNEFKDDLTVNSEETFLSKNNASRKFYINKNIGYFTTDVRGVFTYVSDKVVKFIGLPRDEILQSISWVSHIKNNYDIYNKWLSNIEKITTCIGKMEFEYGKKHYYILYEIWPIIHDNKCVGFTGIFLNVDQRVWVTFDESDIIH